MPYMYTDGWPGYLRYFNQICTKTQHNDGTWVDCTKTQFFVQQEPMDSKPNTLSISTL